MVWKGQWVCTECQRSNCTFCVDVVRAALGARLMCNCKIEGHDGEPIRSQIKDPITGDVFGPGVKITMDGEVTGYDG